MGDLIRYSALTTKIRAMRKNLISKEEYVKLAQAGNVAEVAEFLKGHKSYSVLLGNEDSHDLRRGDIEQAISYSVYNDFERIYRFANMDQKQFLDLYFVRYEESLIKKAIRRCSDEYTPNNLYGKTEKKIDSYTKTNLKAVFEAPDILSIIEALKGSVYYELLKEISDYPNSTNVDYEMALDLYFFKNIWKKRKKYFKGSELKTLTDCIGSEIDMLNIIWIYRAKKFFKMTSSELVAMLIPINYRIKKEKMQQLIEAIDVNDLINIVQGTYYGVLFAEEGTVMFSVEKIYRNIIQKIYQKYYKLEPYSIAVMNAYLRDRNVEMDKLTTIIECIRYGYPPDAIIKQML